MAASAAAPSLALPLANSGFTGPSGPPDSRISPSARAATSAQGTTGSPSPSLSRYAREESAIRFNQPAVFWARSTTVGARAQRSAGPSPMPETGRVQPMIGWTPASFRYWENSSAPNRLARSAMAAAGISALAASLPMSPALIAPSSRE